MLTLTLLFAVLFTSGFIGRKPHERAGAAGRAVTEPGIGGSAETGATTAASAHQAQTALGFPADSASGSVTASSRGLYRNHDAAYWAGKYRHRTRQLQAVRTHLHRRWQPTVDYALRLASAVYGVPYRELYNVAQCESGFNPFARNGKYLGIFQMHWSPFGFSPFDPVASALSTAATVKADGSWRQWECKP